MWEHISPCSAIHPWQTCTKNRSVIFGDDSQKNSWVVHLLRVVNPDCQNNMLTGNDKSVDTLHKSRDQLVICLKTF